MDLYYYLTESVSWYVDHFQLTAFFPTKKGPLMENSTMFVFSFLNFSLFPFTNNKKWLNVIEIWGCTVLISGQPKPVVFMNWSMTPFFLTTLSKTNKIGLLLCHSHIELRLS